MKLTIAICTFNRSELLKENLIVLKKIISGYQDVELVIIDNNSTDDTRDVAAQFVTDDRRIRYILCTQQGLSYARNYAIVQSGALWLAFVDDDAYVDDDWLQQGLRLIDANDYDAFGGVYYPWFKDGQKDWFLPAYESNSSWVEVKDEGRLKTGYFSGGNAFYKVEWLNRIGGFPVGLGMNGKTMSYGEETQAQRAMAVQGARLGFSHKLVIYHYTPMSKQSLAWRWKRSYISGVLFWDIFQKERSPALLRFYLKNSLKSCWDNSMEALKHLKYKHGFKRCFYELSCWVGFLGLVRGYFNK